MIAKFGDKMIKGLSKDDIKNLSKELKELKESKNISLEKLEKIIKKYSDKIENNDNDKNIMSPQKLTNLKKFSILKIIK